MPTSGIALPVLYWTTDSGTTWNSATGSHVSGNDYSFMFGAGVPEGGTVQYYVAAQDSVGNVATNPAGGMDLTSGPPAAATVPTTLNSYTLPVMPTVTIDPLTATICEGEELLLTATGAFGTGTAEPELSTVLNSLNTNASNVLNTLTNFHGFSMDGGTNPGYISDGGGDMYDAGNYIGTDLNGQWPYSDNVIMGHGALGAGGQYFTRVLQSGTGSGTGTRRVFTWAGDINGLSTIGTTGGLGADGG